MAILNSMDKTDLQLHRITEILHGLLPTARESPVALHEPCLAGHEWDYVKDCLDSGWVSSVGSYVNRFERQLEELLGVGNAVVVLYPIKRLVVEVAEMERPVRVGQRARDDDT